jgi:cytochrome P450
VRCLGKCVRFARTDVFVNNIAGCAARQCKTWDSRGAESVGPGGPPDVSPLSQAAASTAPTSGHRRPAVGVCRQAGSVTDTIGCQSGSAFRSAILGIRYVVAAGADVIHDLNDESRFEKHLGPEIDALRSIGGDGLFTARTGELNWFAAHELLMPAFSQSARRRYHDDMLDVTSELIARWDTAAGKRTVNVPANTTRAILETVVQCSAGYMFDLFGARTTHPHVRHMVAGLKRAGLLGMVRASCFPQLVAQRVERSLRRHGAHWAKVADQIIAARWAAADEHARYARICSN